MLAICPFAIVLERIWLPKVTISTYQGVSTMYYRFNRAKTVLFYCEPLVFIIK